MLQRAFQTAGYEVPTPFPRMTYSQAMRSYGIDKPDLRLPPFHVLDESWQLGLGLTFPPVAIHIPKTGALSRKEAAGIARDLGVKQSYFRFSGGLPGRVVVPIWIYGVASI